MALVRKGIRIAARGVILASLGLLLSMNQVPGATAPTSPALLTAQRTTAQPVPGPAVSEPAPAAPAATEVRAEATPIPSLPTSAPPEPGPAAPAEAPSGWVTIPALSLNAIPIFDRGLNVNREMLIAPGFATTHYQFSGSLGGSSNAVLYGHEGGVFEGLHKLRGGDRVVLKLATGSTLTYVVKGSPTLVAPTQISILNPTSTAQLTLFTCCCWPADDDNRRLVVVATSI